MTLYKFNCNRRCSLNGGCKRCLQVYKTANLLEKKNLGLKRKFQGNSEQLE